MMDTVKYEHHSGAMYVSALCPFKIKSATAPNHLTANWHRNPEIIYITGGEGTVQCGSESFLARTGDIFIINPETIHHITATDLLEYTFIIIDERFCRDNGIDLETCRFKPHVRDGEAESHIRRII